MMMKEFIIRRIKIFSGALLIALFFSMLLVNKFLHEGLGIMVLLTYIQLEIFIWLGTWFFKDVKISSDKARRFIVYRLLIFYAAVLAISTVFFISVFYIQYRTSNYGFESFSEALSNLEMKSFTIATLIGFAIGALVFFYSQWSDALKREQKLAQEKLIFQYETLRNQINPHFLFNSLNTLSSLVRTNPDLSEEYIQKFSGIYRYILENQESNLVPLSQELQFVRDYFSLQKIRDEEKINLSIEINNEGSLQVPPVSLQLLVENALKHNSATRNNPLDIVIYNEGIDKLVVSNNIQPKTSITASSRKGLKNLNERSRLILNREIEILQSENFFVVKIPAKMLQK
jgi:two-component system, LytTR family, sensor kinase